MSQYHNKWFEKAYLESPVLQGKKIYQGGNIGTYKKCCSLERPKLYLTFMDEDGRRLSRVRLIKAWACAAQKTHFFQGLMRRLIRLKEDGEPIPICPASQQEVIDRYIETAHVLRELAGAMVALSWRERNSYVQDCWKPAAGPIELSIRPEIKRFADMRTIDALCAIWIPSLFISVAHVTLSDHRAGLSDRWLDIWDRLQPSEGYERPLDMGRISPVLSNVLDEEDSYLRFVDKYGRATIWDRSYDRSSHSDKSEDRILSRCSSNSSSVLTLVDGSTTCPLHPLHHECILSHRPGSAFRPPHRYRLAGIRPSLCHPFTEDTVHVGYRLGLLASIPPTEVMNNYRKRYDSIYNK
ncbi:hypothetical protein, variant 1 [Cryptococcus amylolentus CBS 6039]|uniref:Uncharacterized protein n=1 Tax=Cryptococcus amylolentus CBS 6039 TaxID=1295533 RepID=A0A1E3HAZ3_9TREE|nr:hypothetical protein, variant 1 [Cryptococcus amylolentus CBS 6039]ODN73512.1 hypothetical protein, variant 1 [Cryptococcus amylolentus CBS 6039]